MIFIQHFRLGPSLCINFLNLWIVTEYLLGRKGKAFVLKKHCMIICHWPVLPQNNAQEINGLGDLSAFLLHFSPGGYFKYKEKTEVRGKPLDFYSHYARKPTQELFSVYRYNNKVCNWLLNFK